MNRIPMTLEGEKQLRAELDQLKLHERPAIIEAISTAREHGDLKENAEYHAAREKQAFCEGRIQDIEAKLSNAQVIDVTEINADGKVIFGATVTFADVDSGETTSYKIVGDDEADIKSHKISVNAPIARALIGKHVDDEVTINTPDGEKTVDITQVQYI